MLMVTAQEWLGKQVHSEGGDRWLCRVFIASCLLRLRWWQHQAFPCWLLSTWSVFLVTWSSPLASLVGPGPLTQPRPLRVSLGALDPPVSAHGGRLLRPLPALLGSPCPPPARTGCCWCPTCEKGPCPQQKQGQEPQSLTRNPRMQGHTSAPYWMVSTFRARPGLHVQLGAPGCPA